MGHFNFGRTMDLLWISLACIVSITRVHGDTDPVVLQLMTRVDALEQQGVVQRERIQQLEEEVRELKYPDTVLTDHSDANQKKRFVLDTEEVAFHATLDGPLYEHNHVNQQIVFADVKLNIGDAYNNKTGIFVTPMNGIYIFSVSVMSYHTNNTVHIDLLRNGVEVAAAYGYGYDQGSVTATMKLNIGDVITANIERHEDIVIWGDKLTSFTGCLVVPY